MKGDEPGPQPGQVGVGTGGTLRHHVNIEGRPAVSPEAGGDALTALEGGGEARAHDVEVERARQGSAAAIP